MMTDHLEPGSGALPNMPAPRAARPGPYYAVPDPTDAQRMTYWREIRSGLAPWPPKARYAPALHNSDVPKTLRGRRRQKWINQWFESTSRPWYDAVHRAIEGDPVGAQARFAAFSARCCCRGRRLTDAASKTYGIGPECRSGMPDGVLAALTEQIGRAHAARAVEQVTR